MIGRRVLTIGGLVAAAVGSIVLAAGPASATAVSTATPVKPAWASSVTKSSGNSFKTASVSTATYYTTTYVYRSTASSIACGTTGCSGTGLLLLNSGSYNVSVAGNTTFTLPSTAAVSANCAAQTTTTKQTRYYWTYFKVADSAGNVKWSLSSSLSGTYC